MKRVRYKKYEGGLADELNMEDLLEAMSDYLLDSGLSQSHDAVPGSGADHGGLERGVTPRDGVG